MVSLATAFLGVTQQCAQRRGLRCVTSQTAAMETTEGMQIYLCIPFIPVLLLNYNKNKKQQEETKSATTNRIVSKIYEYSIVNH